MTQTRKTTNTHYGFTLAEVLVTLGIIGVVAALTVPSLTQKATEKALSTARKKVYSELSQAVGNAMADKHAVKVSEIKMSVGDFYTTYLRPTTSVGSASSLGMTGSYATSNNCVFLKDGAFVCINSFDGDRTIAVDVNGKQGPNASGKDILSGSIDDRGDITLSGGEGGGGTCSSKNGVDVSGIGCVVNAGSANWEGAKQACSSQGMTLPDIDTLKSIYDSHTDGLPTSGTFWSSSEYVVTDYAYIVYFYNGYQFDNDKSSQHGVLCVGN